VLVTGNPAARIADVRNVETRVPPGYRVRSGEARGVSDGKSGVVVIVKDVKSVQDVKG
jgi:hypothetical protein